jgi:RNA polymerase sigma-70 factor, ECF subfamily
MDITADRTQGFSGGDLAYLVERCGVGDGAAWNRLLSEVRRLAIDLGRWKYRMSREDAEDMAQVVQIRVAERLSQLRDPGAFPCWVRRLVHRAAVDSLRQQRQHLSLDDPDTAVLETDVAPVQTDEYDQILLRADLDRALSRLPDHYREPIRLHVLQGIPQDDVGRLLGRPRSTVASQIERGLHRLQRSMSGFSPASC